MIFSVKIDFLRTQWCGIGCYIIKIYNKLIWDEDMRVFVDFYDFCDFYDFLRFLAIFCDFLGDFEKRKGVAHKKEFLFYLEF